MAIAKRDQQELNGIIARYQERYGGCREDYFSLVYLPKKFKCTVEEVAAQVAFGGNDYGIDAYYIDRAGRNLYLFQFKWSEDHNQFKPSLERLADAGMERIFGDPLQDPTQNELLVNLRNDLSEYRELIDRVYVRFVFKGDAEKAERSEGLNYLKEKVDSRNWLVQSFFQRKVVFPGVEFLSDKRTAPRNPPTDSHTVSITNHICVPANGPKVLHVVFMSLMDLHGIYKSLGLTFFDRNVRAGLSADNPPNTKMREALASIVLNGEQDPLEFVFNHNGITLAAERVQFEGEQVSLFVPRLLNGAQTITSVDQFIEDHQGNPDLKKNEKRLRNILVMAKIIQDNPWGEFVTNVTICNNRQNPVHSWNLRANDRIQCELHDRFIEKAGIFYSRQENAFQNLSNSDLEELGVQDSKDIRIKPLAQTFLASQGEIDKMSRLPEVFDKQNEYESAFRESYLQSDVRRIILAYKVGLSINSPMQRLEEIAPQKYAYAINKARNLVWALLIQSVLNDHKLPMLLEDFGGSLVREEDFRDLLKKTASAKLLPVLKQVLSSDTYSEKVAAEKYSFLRTKELFRRCMEVASANYGWSKRFL